MKKIGIMSMQRIVNYGSFLQAYGLKKTIEELGNEVQFVDYEFEKSVIGNPKKNYLKKIINNINILGHKKKIKHINLFRKEYANYINKYLGISDKKNYYPNIDTLVIGSDEVFNCLQYYPVGYSRNLFGFGYEKARKISYAASFGHTTIEGLKKYNIDKEISKLLLKFDSISVRDDNSKKIIKELINKDVQINCDPVIISDFDQEINNENVLEKDYIVIYAYSGRLSKNEEKEIKRFAKKYNKKIISLGFYQRIADINLVVNPFLVLKYIKCADYVITDTFHGTVFSLKMNTKFCTIIRKSNYNKLYSLLNKFCLTSQLVNNINDIEKLYHQKINFKKCNKIIEEEKNKTKKYLINSL